MNLFSLAGLCLAIFCLLLAIIILRYAKNKTHRIWAIFNINVAIWGGCTFLAGISQTESSALLNWKIVYIPCTFISIIFYHLVCAFCNLTRSRMLIFAYLQGVLFIPLIFFTNYFIEDVGFSFNSFYYHKATIMFTFWLFIWSLITFFSFFELFKFIKSVTGIKKVQSLYLFWGMSLGFAGGTTTVIPSFGIPIYPAWHFTICIYAGVMSYAMFKYRFMDISIAATRTSVFIAVYSVVLGIPFAIAFGLKDSLQSIFYDNWWIIPMITSTLFSTLGPYFYLFFQRRAEDKLLQEQRQYQSTLRQASRGMGRIKDLRKLLNLIVHIVIRAVRIEHCKIFLFHEMSNKFVLKASKGEKDTERDVSIIYSDSLLIKYLKQQKEPIVYDEIKERMKDFPEKKLVQLEVILNNLNSTLIVPSFIENRLIALIILGAKKSGKLYSQDDLAVFSILANQAALAIENAQFYEDMKRTHEQLFKAEKMATIGTMADGLSHQINNRLHAMGFIAGDALDTIQFRRKKGEAELKAESLQEVEHALERIQDNVKKGGEIVEGLLKYTRKGSEGFEQIKLNQLLNSALDMVQFKVKLDQINFEKNFDPDKAEVFGNFTQLQEVFFNLIDNANDAMQQRKNDLKEEGFQPCLEIAADKKGTKLEIVITDNGIGVKKEDVQKLFTPFFTTKLSSRKGTGLGLYVIRQIIEENHKGKVTFVSEYTKGSVMTILLPTASKAKKSETKDVKNV